MELFNLLFSLAVVLGRFLISGFHLAANFDNLLVLLQKILLKESDFVLQLLLTLVIMLINLDDLL